MRIHRGFVPVFIRECYRIATSKICIWGLVVAPIMALAFFTYMMHEGQPRKLPIAVVDLDNSAASRALIRQLDAFAKVDIKYKELSFSQANKLMEQGRIYAIMYIPNDFSKDAITGKQPKLEYYTNNTSLISGSLLYQDLKTISTLASASVTIKTASAKGLHEEQIMSIASPITTDIHPLSNPYLNYSVYLSNLLIPATMQLIIIMLTVSCLGSEIKAKRGNFLLGLSGNSILKTIAGKLLPYTIVSLLMSLLCMSVLYGYLRFPLKNGFWPMFVNYLLMIVSAQSLGLILFGCFRNYRFALSIASLIGVITFSAMGMSFPVQAMDGVLQSLSYTYPMRFFLLIHADQALNGIPIGYSLHYYGAYLIFIVSALALFVPIKKELSRNIYEP